MFVLIYFNNSYKHVFWYKLVASLLNFNHCFWISVHFFFFLIFYTSFWRITRTFQGIAYHLNGICKIARNSLFLRQLWLETLSWWQYHTYCFGKKHICDTFDCKSFNCFDSSLLICNTILFDLNIKPFCFCFVF